MTQFGGMKALPDFGYRRRLYFNAKILFGELDENLEGFTATEIPWLKFCFSDLRTRFLSLPHHWFSSLGYIGESFIEISSLFISLFKKSVLLVSVFSG